MVSVKLLGTLADAERHWAKPAGPTSAGGVSCEAGKARSFGLVGRWPTERRRVPTSLPAAVIKIHEVDVRRKVEKNSLLGGDFVQRFIDVRQMMVRDVAYELPVDFVIAHAAMQPAQKHDQLNAGGRSDRK